MITITNEDVYGFEAAVRGMRNPMNSWAKSDSSFDDGVVIGENDLDLMKKLAKAGVEHCKYLRGIYVSCDITAPLYWWKQMDTYTIGAFKNSCSTMHKVHAKEFELSDFSTEHLPGVEECVLDDEACVLAVDYQDLAMLKACVLAVDYQDLAMLKITPKSVLETTIGMLNKARELYLETKDQRYWWIMIQLLPDSYGQLRTWYSNYAVLRKIYRERKNHKLDEWHTFCDWVETLPYSELITD